MGPEELMANFDKCQKVPLIKKTSKISGVRQMTAAEQDFINTLKEALPPVISRKDLSKYLGGVVSKSLLSHADAKGEGPAVTWKIGEHSVAYKTFGKSKYL